LADMVQKLHGKTPSRETDGAAIKPPHCSDGQVAC
jgi:hypothetical protein